MLALHAIECVLDQLVRYREQLDRVFGRSGHRSRCSFRLRKMASNTATSEVAGRFRLIVYPSLIPPASSSGAPPLGSPPSFSSAWGRLPFVAIAEKSAKALSALNDAAIGPMRLEFFSTPVAWTMRSFSFWSVASCAYSLIRYRGRYPVRSASAAAAPFLSAAEPSVELCRRAVARQEAGALEVRDQRLRGTTRHLQRRGEVVLAEPGRGLRVPDLVQHLRDVAGGVYIRQRVLGHPTPLLVARYSGPNLTR